MTNVKKLLKGKLSEEKLAKIKKEIAESLALDRHGLICDFPFTAAIAMRMDLIPTRDKRVRTACTDGKRVFFDCDFYSKLKKNERAFVLAHEIWHCVMLHLSRCQTRNKELFNIASDMEVNQLLVDNANGKIIAPPKNVLFPPSKLKGKSAEVIYDWLLKQANKQQKQQNSQNNSSQKDKGKNQITSGLNDNIDSDGDDEDSRDECSSESNSVGNGKNGKNGKDTGKLEGQFDKHTYTGDNGDSDVDEKVTDQWGEVGYDDDFNPDVPDDIAEQMREASIAAAQQCQREKGDLPAGVKQLLDKIQKPEIRWQEVLSQFVTSCYNGKRRWLPPNRRHVYNDMYFQSRRNEVVNIAVAIDTSGSCVGDLPKFFGELNGLVNSFGSYTIHLIQCDAAVDKYDVYDDNNPFDIEDGSKIEWAGGGGTSFCPVFKFMKKEGIQVDCLIYITDGFGDAPEEPPPYPVLWILTKDGCEDFCDWGKKIKFKNSSYDY